MPSPTQPSGLAPAGFEIDLARREVRAHGAVMPLGGRAFEIVVELAEAAGDLVTKDALMQRVWPGAIIEENTLQVHISAIRKALGPDRELLQTVSGRGYHLLGAWRVSSDRPWRDETAVAKGAAPPRHSGQNVWDGSATLIGQRPVAQGSLPPLSRRTNVSAAAGNLIGRAAALRDIRDLLSACRAVTLIGPGGIGKTRLALEVAREHAGDRCLVELASLSDPALVPSTVASVLGLSIAGTEIAAEPIARAIGDRVLLLVLDNCEHVIETAAAVAETVLRVCPNVTVLATSREVLRIAGEHVYRVSPLEVPPPQQDTASELVRHSAVQLFLARTAAMAADYSTEASSLSAIAEICRRLDGIPLAIEFAAAHAATLGVSQVAAMLDNRFHLLTGGHRTALPRHQTLRAVLDWSYHLLPESERRFFRRLAVFSSGFTVDAVAVVTPDITLDSADVAEDIADLVSKSLVVFDKSGTLPRWYLLDTIRAYALEKIDEAGERPALASRHARYCRDLLQRCEASGEWRAEDRPRIDDLRAALQWATSPEGDSEILIELTAAAIPLWVDLSLMTECRQRIEAAIARLSLVVDPDPHHEMQLRAALGMSLNYTTGPVTATAAAWARTLEIATALRNVEYQLRALRGLWAHHMNAGEYRRALELAREFQNLAARDGCCADQGFGDRMAALVLHYLGNQEQARSLIEPHLARRINSLPHSQISRFLLDQDVTEQALLSRILWIQGFPDRAAHIARSSVERAEAIGHALSLCHALAQAACPIALNNGDLQVAEAYVVRLLDTSSELGLAGWIARSHCFQGVLSIMQNRLDVGLPLLRSALDELRHTGAAPAYPAFLGMLAQGLGRAGRLGEGLQTIEKALELCDRSEERWCLPELLRHQGELRLLERSPGSISADECFRQAIVWAQRDGALSWELRASTSLARLLHDQGGTADALRLLQPVYARFTEGFGSADLMAAKELLGNLRLD